MSEAQNLYDSYFKIKLFSTSSTFYVLNHLGNYYHPQNPIFEQKCWKYSTQNISYQNFMNLKTFLFCIMEKIVFSRIYLRKKINQQAKRPDAKIENKTNCACRKPNILPCELRGRS